jgi:hypothetical protein
MEWEVDWGKSPQKITYTPPHTKPRYDEFQKILIKNVPNRWARTGKDLKKNLENLNDIANYFERSFKYIFGAAIGDNPQLRKVGSDPDYKTGKKNEDGSYYITRKCVHGHLGFYGSDYDETYLSSCLKFEGFNEFVEYDISKLREFDGQLITWVYNDVALIVDVRKGKDLILKLGTETKKHNIKVHIKTLFDHNLVPYYFKYNGKTLYDGALGKEVELKTKNNQAFQNFMMKPHNGDTYIVVKLQDDLDTPYCNIGQNKKELYDTMKAANPNVKTYRAFTKGIAATTQDVINGKIPQRPIIYKSKVGNIIIINNGEATVEQIDSYKKSLESKLYKTSSSSSSLEGTQFLFKIINTVNSVKKTEITKSFHAPRVNSINGAPKNSEKEKKWSKSSGTMTKNASMYHLTEKPFLISSSRQNIQALNMTRKPKSGMAKLSN